jgi:hypothetical protein
MQGDWVILSSACSEFTYVISEMEGRKISWHFLDRRRSHYIGITINFCSQDVTFLDRSSLRYVLPTEALFPILYKFRGHITDITAFALGDLPPAKTLRRVCTKTLYDALALSFNFLKANLRWRSRGNLTPVSIWLWFGMIGQIWT